MFIDVIVSYDLFGLCKIDSSPIGMMEMAWRQTSQ